MGIAERKHKVGRKEIERGENKDDDTYL